jgi:hypothetical protein
MIKTPVLPALILSAALGACQPAADAPTDRSTVEETAAASQPAEPAQPAAQAPLPAQASDDWQVYAKPSDVQRLSRLDSAWEEGLKRARAEGHEAELDALGSLAKPGGGLTPRVQPAPGEYRCRTYKLGGEAQGLPFVAYPYFKCAVELTPGGDLIVRKLDGSQRFEGKLYPERDNRLVYLGAAALGSETPPAYGDDAERDQIGVLARVGDQRWRLALPWPQAESVLDIIELVK